jgi:hypothetical protein
MLLALLAPPSPARAQNDVAAVNRVHADDLPDAPKPLVVEGTADSAAAPSRDAQDGTAQQPATGSTAPQQSSSSQATSQSADEQNKEQKAQQQIKEQEKQRVLGIVPAFNTSYRSDAVSLTAKQKISVAFRSAVDPVTFATAMLVAGYGEALDSDSGFPWGAKGFGERAGAKYLDAFDGNMIGNGFLPALLRQDPRYFRLGHDPVRHRLLYAIASNVICKHDNTGKWEPNYSNVLGNIASGALSNLYYPATNDSGFSVTIGNGMTVTAEGAIGSVFQEFWPDLSRKLLHKDPTNGLDAQARDADRAAKQAKQNAK